MLTPWSSVEVHAAADPVKLSTADGRLTHAEFVEKHVPEARDGYWYYNALYLGSGDFQTMASSGDYERDYPVWYGRRLFRWSDNAQVSVDYALQVSERKPPNWDEDATFRPEADTPPLPKRTRYFRREEIAPLDDAASTQPLLLSLHGLTGGSHENYVRGLITEMSKVYPDMECIVMNTRGCNRTKITTPQLFNGGWTEDVRLLVQHITTQQPQRPIFLVGYSLGASVLVNYLGQEGTNLPRQVRAAAPVSAPWDLMICSLIIKNSFLGRHVYETQMASNLKRLVKNNRQELRASPVFREHEHKVDRVRTIAEFDDYMTAPLFGFTGSWDYYRSASCVQRLGNVRTPMLVLSAKDDPICGDIATPYTDCKANPYVHLVTTTHGGHLGWFGAGSGPRWYAAVLAKYFSAFATRTDLKSSVEAPPGIDKPRWFRDGKFQVSDTLHEVPEPSMTN